MDLLASVRAPGPDDPSTQYLFQFSASMLAPTPPQDQPFARGAYTGFFAPGVMSVPEILGRFKIHAAVFINFMVGPYS